MSLWYKCKLGLHNWYYNARKEQKSCRECPKKKYWCPPNANNCPYCGKYMTWIDAVQKSVCHSCTKEMCRTLYKVAML